MDYILCMYTFQFLVCLHVQEKKKKGIPSEWFEDCAKQKKKKIPVELEVHWKKHSKTEQPLELNRAFSTFDLEN